MIVRSLQPRITQHLMIVAFVNFRSLVLTLFSVDEGISRGLWSNSSSFDPKGKKPTRGQKSKDVSVISFISQSPSKHHQLTPQIVQAYFPYPQHRYRPSVPPQPFPHTYLYLAPLQSCYTTWVTKRLSTLFLHFALTMS